MKKSLRMSCLYNNVLCNVISEYKDKPFDKNYYRKVAFYGTKVVVLMPRGKDGIYGDARTFFRIICFVKEALSQLTPKEIVNLFPIQKIYDGERWGCKDYFYTRNYLSKLPQDEIIGENIDELLWEYVNTDLRVFNTACLMSVDELRRAEGKRSMMEEWAQMNGVKTYSLHKDNQGKEYLYDKSTGKTIKVKKKRPRYLKVVK